MANPLSLMLPIIPGTSVATLSGILEQYVPQLYAGLESVGTVHYARALFLDTSKANLLPTGIFSTGPFVIAIITEYDGDFDTYIQDFVSAIGDVFNAVLPYVVGGAALVPVANNVAAFQAFLAQNDASQQAPNNVALAESYTATVQQILAALPGSAATSTASPVPNA